MSLKVVTAPKEEPLSIAEARSHLRIPEDDRDEDVDVDATMRAAREQVETVLGQTLITTTWELRIDSFADEIHLPRPPVQSITEIRYLDSAGVEQVLSASVYELTSSGQNLRRPTIRLRYGQSWPTVRGDREGIRIKYVAGYGDARQVPQRFRQALKLLLGHYFENREAVITGTIATVLPEGVMALLGPERMSFVS